MTTNFSREAAADHLENLTFGDTRLLCRAGTAGWEGNEERVFDDYARVKAMTPIWSM